MSISDEARNTPAMVGTIQWMELFLVISFWHKSL